MPVKKKNNDSVPHTQTLSKSAKKHTHAKSRYLLSLTAVSLFLFILFFVIIFKIEGSAKMNSFDHLKQGFMALNEGDYIQAKKHLIRAGEGKNPLAYFTLGSMEMDGRNKEKKKNPVQAANFFQKAAYLGSKDGQYMLALLYDRGEGIPEDKKKALNWGLLAAAQGDIDALYAAAVWLERGYDGTPQPIIALSLYEMAAEKGHVNAMSSLISIYSSGENGIPQNLPRAQYWRNRLEMQTQTKKTIQK